MDLENPERPLIQKTRRVAHATGVVGLVTLLSRILGMLRDITIASSLGAGFLSDAFFVAFRIPNLLRRVVAEGSLATAFIPIFTEDLKYSRARAQQTLRAIAGLSLMFSVPLTVLGIIFADEIVHLISPGFGIGTEKAEIAASLLIVMFPYAVLITLTALASSALNALGAFGLASAPSVILNLAMIISIAALSEWFVRPVFAPASAVVIAGVISLGALVYQLKSLGMPFRIGLPWKSPRTKDVVMIFLPSLLSASVYQIIVFVNSLLASMLEEGSISWLYYSDRIFQFPLGVFTLALATAALPQLSKLASEEKLEELGSELSVYLSWISFLTLPAAFSLIVFSLPITSIMYERGSFGREEVLNTAAALSCYAVGLWTLSCHSVVVRAFLSLKQSLIPSLVSVGAILLNVVLAFALMGPTEVELDSGFAQTVSAIQRRLHIYSFGHSGIALAGSLASFFSFYGLVLLLPRIGVRVYFEDIMPSILRSFGASIPMLLVLKGLLFLDIPTPVTVIIGVPLGAAVYFTAAHYLGMAHTRQTLAVVLGILKKFYR